MNSLFNKLLVTSAMCAACSAHALSPARPSPIELKFPPNSTSLSEEQQQRVVSAIEKLRADNWCWFGAAIVEGFSSDSEGDRDQQERLALARAKLVADILDRYRIPRSHVYVSVGRDSKGQWAYDGPAQHFVSLTFNATTSLGAICQPLDARSGLRLSPLDGHPHK
jgi:hypothetical protein